jgi:hypothetical protein
LPSQLAVQTSQAKVSLQISPASQSPQLPPQPSSPQLLPSHEAVHSPQPFGAAAGNSTSQNSQMSSQQSPKPKHSSSQLQVSPVVPQIPSQLGVGHAPQSATQFAQVSVPSHTPLPQDAVQPTMAVFVQTPSTPHASAVQLSPSEQSLAAPVQTPAAQASALVQRSPSSQTAPSGLAAVAQAPVAGSQVDASQAPSPV